MLETAKYLGRPDLRGYALPIIGLGIIATVLWIKYSPD
jgi:hypothetical protein